MIDISETILYFKRYSNRKALKSLRKLEKSSWFKKKKKSFALINLRIECVSTEFCAITIYITAEFRIPNVITLILGIPGMFKTVYYVTKIRRKKTTKLFVK